MEGHHHGEWTRIIFNRFNSFNDQKLEQGSALKLSEFENRIMQICFEIHDWPESVKGDISYDQKTEDQEKTEQIVLHDMMSRYLFGDNRYSAHEINLISQIIFGPKESNERLEILHEIFNTIERIGYLRTALKAWQRGYQKLKDDNDEDSKILTKAYLTGSVNVILNQLEKLNERVEKYPCLKAFLGHYQKTIESIFEEVDQRNNPQIYNTAFAIYPDNSEKKERYKCLQKGKI